MNDILKIVPIKAFKDNYIWLLFNPHNRCAMVVDPGDATPVLTVLNKEKLKLIGILITHHHWDHTGGVLELVEKTHAPVYGGANEPIPGLNHPLSDSDSIQFKELELTLHILDIPGHTLGHIAYYSNKMNEEMLFSGDTLFTGGCGRLFEGTAEQMICSLTKLKNLSPNTKVYCGHEYTLNNLRFAKLLEPENAAIERRLHMVENLRAEDKPTVPAHLSEELETNPFLRTEQTNVIKATEQHFGTKFNSNIQIFKAIREWKNHF